MVNLRLRKVEYKSAAATEHASQKEEAVSDTEQVGYVKIRYKKGLAERGDELIEKAKPVASAAAGVFKGGIHFLTGGMVDGEVRRKRPARDSGGGGFDMFDFGGSSQRKRSSGGGLDITNLPDPFGSSGRKGRGSRRNAFSDPFDELITGVRPKKKRKKHRGEIVIHIRR